MDSHRMAGENDYSPSRPGSGCPDWTMTHPTPWIFLMNYSPPTALTSSPTQIIPSITVPALSASLLFS